MDNVTTYADGRGRWHARVDFDSPRGPQWMDANVTTIRARARRAIRRQILARESGPIAAVRVEVVADIWRPGVSPDHMNQWHSITFAEKA